MSQTPSFKVLNYGGILHIFDPVYRMNIWAVAGASHKTFCRLMKKELGATFAPTKSDGKFYTYVSKGRTVGVIWSSDKSVHLMHECAHATFWAMRERGIGFSEDAEDAFCYYQSFLFRALTGW